MNTILDPALREAILNPINGELAVGIDCREDIAPSSPYQVVREARAVARSNERAALAEGDARYFSTAEWQIIIQKAPEILAHVSKDLEVLAWYIEALCRIHGFVGLAVGFDVAAELLQRFGATMYPMPDEEGIGSQLSTLSGLNGFGAEGTLIGPIKSILLTEGDEPGPLAAWQCEQAFEIERIQDADRRAARIRQGGISREEVNRVVGETSTPFLQGVAKDIELAKGAFSRFVSAIDWVAQEDPQPTAKIKDTLDACSQMLIYIAGDRLKTPDEEELEPPSEGEPDATEEVSMSKNGTVQPKARDQAIAQLREVANFFRRTEPHSPISYSIEQAIRWSDLPLTELIKELIPDDGARSKFQNLSGIQGEGK